MRRREAGTVRRLRPYTTLSVTVPPQEPASETMFDVWLKRASHISQFGLFLITVGALFYTVIPLYEKALLEEQISKKEIELAKIQKAYVTTYDRVRALEVSKFTFQAGVECSGLMIPPGTRVDGIKGTSLEIDPIECFDRMAQGGLVDDLTPQDKRRS